VAAQYQSRTAEQIQTYAPAFHAPSTAGALVLVADDSEEDRFFLMRAFAASGVKNPVHMLSSGAEVLDYMMGQGNFQNRAVYPLPKIVLLDLQMPHPNGFTVLRWSQSRHLPPILWVAMSQFDTVRSINEAYAAGASTFLAKPLQADDIKNLVQAFEDFGLLARPSEWR
jgi:two-component system response regulator